MEMMDNDEAAFNLLKVIKEKKQFKSKLFIFSDY
jgi:hypothetical protein